MKDKIIVAAAVIVSAIIGFCLATVLFCPPVNNIAVDSGDVSTTVTEITEETTAPTEEPTTAPTEAIEDFTNRKKVNLLVFDSDTIKAYVTAVETNLKAETVAIEVLVTDNKDNAISFKLNDIFINDNALDTNVYGIQLIKGVNFSEVMIEDMLEMARSFKITNGRVTARLTGFIPATFTFN